MIINTTFTARGDADPRVAELTELAASEHLTFRIGLTAAIDMTLWLEDRGYAVDFRTGVAMQVELLQQVAGFTPTGRAVNHLLSPVTDDDVETTINGLFTATSEECAPDGTLQMMVDDADSDISFYDSELQCLRDGRDDIDFWGHHC